ncbi:hypothetical protein BDF22DRAFT_663483 [Syncephalis plumigaleata]|nr:hypothetical protein BDF22DRAFT_663483 [Syncephalis plumigaleata]
MSGRQPYQLNLEAAAQIASTLPTYPLSISSHSKQFKRTSTATVHRPVAVAASLLSHNEAATNNQSDNDTSQMMESDTAVTLSRSNNSSVCPLSTPSEEPNDPIGMLEDSQPVFNTADDAIFERVCRQLENLLNSAEEAILTPIQLSSEDYNVEEEGEEEEVEEETSTISTVLLGNIDMNTNHQSSSTSSIKRAHLPRRLRNVHARCTSDQISTGPLSPISFNSWYDNQATQLNQSYDSLIQSTTLTSSIADNHNNDSPSHVSSMSTVVKASKQKQQQQYCTSSPNEQWMSNPLSVIGPSLIDWYQRQTVESPQTTPLELLSEFPLLVYHIYRRISALFTWLIRLLMACWHHRAAFFRLLYRLLSLLRRAKTTRKPMLCKTCHQPINQKK